MTPAELDAIEARWVSGPQGCEMAQHYVTWQILDQGEKDTTAMAKALRDSWERTEEGTRLTERYVQRLHKAEDRVRELEAGEVGDCTNCGATITNRTLNMAVGSLICGDCDDPALEARQEFESGLP